MWIKERIDAEYRKHYKITGGLDWSKLAEVKIKSQIKEIIEKCDVHGKIFIDKKQLKKLLISEEVRP